MSVQISDSTSCRIEVSGWDVNENFFVEKTNLVWSEEQGKKVYLRHSLRDHAVVFVRLIHPTASGPTFPIAFQAEHTGTADRDGMWEVRLVQLHPRTGGGDCREGFAEGALVEMRR